MAKPLTDDERARIVDLLNEGHSANDIAKRTHRSVNTVSRIAKSIGHQFAQTNLARAHEARSAYSAERRATIAARLTVEAELLLDELHGEYLVHNFGGKDNTYAEHKLEQPPTEAKHTIVRAVGQAMKTVLDIDKHDNRDAENLSGFDAWWADRMGDGA